jgi:hypothetical protein
VDWLIRFSDDGAAVDWFAGDDAFAGAVVFVDEGDIAGGGLEFLEAGVASGVVGDVGHDELTADFFGGDVLFLAMWHTN